MKRRALAILLAALVSSSAAAADGERAAKVLRESTRFATLYAGKSTEPSSVSRAFFWMMAHNRGADFLGLIEADNSAARLYGLCGLRQLSAPRYAEARSRLARDRTEVSLLTGCIVRHTTVGEALTRDPNRHDSSSFDAVCDTLRDRLPGL
jgi:hypothetical protein